MEWVESDGMTAKGVLQLAKTDLVETLSAIVTRICSNHLPLRRHAEVGIAVKTGLVNACRFLLKNPDDIRDETVCRVLFGLPPYWEPPVSRAEPPWPHHQLRAYRWTATIVAYWVRNALEDLHSECIPDRLMPALNRAVRDAIYEFLICKPTFGWRLSRMPRAFLTVMADIAGHLQLPRSVG